MVPDETSAKERQGEPHALYCIADVTQKPNKVIDGLRAFPDVVFLAICILAISYLFFSIVISPLNSPS